MLRGFIFFIFLKRNYKQITTMHNNEMMEKEEIYSKVLRAGRRTYFFDVRATKAGDYYLTITESKKFTNDDGSFHYKKHKIYLYKEDFNEFNSILKEMTDYVIAEKGDEVISDRHQKDFKKEYDTPAPTEANTETTEASQSGTSAESRFTDIDFDDI